MQTPNWMWFASLLVLAGGCNGDQDDPLSGTWRGQFDGGEFDGGKSDGGKSDGDRLDGNGALTTVDEMWLKRVELRFFDRHRLEMRLQLERRGKRWEEVVPATYRVIERVPNGRRIVLGIWGSGPREGEYRQVTLRFETDDQFQWTEPDSNVKLPPLTFRRADG